MSLSSFENVTKIAEHIRKTSKLTPLIGIICGSGLGKLADGIQDRIVIPYEEIPGFPRSTVVGHKGNLVFGHLGGKTVVAMQGRFHMYEGHSADVIALPIRVMRLLGVQTLFISNAAGGLNRNLKTGDFVIIKDHISMPGLSLNNVLVGHNDESFGSRFPAMSNAYSPELRELAVKLATDDGFSNLVHQGVYAYCGGPTYETPAESKMLLMLGADVVGMSTAPEVVIARHCGIKVFAVSLVTNISILDVESTIHTNHEEVLETAEKRAGLLQKWLTRIIESI